MSNPTTSRLRGIVLITGLLLLAGACRGGSAPETPAPAPEEPPMLPLAAGAQLYYDDRGGITDSTRIVVRDVGDWTERWNQATSRRDDPPPRPEVDFETHMVLVVAAGRMSPGDRVQVDSAGVRTERTTEDEAEVFEVVIRTIEGCGALRADIYPITIVRLPRFDGRVAFVERSTQATCNGNS